MSYSSVPGPFYHNCHGYWDSDIVWHPGKVTPEYYMIEAFIEQIRKKKEFDKIYFGLTIANYKNFCQFPIVTPVKLKIVNDYAFSFSVADSSPCGKRKETQNDNSVYSR